MEPATLLTDIKSAIGQPNTTATVTLSCSNATSFTATSKTCVATFDSAVDAATIKRMVGENKIPGAMSASYDDGNSPAPPSDDDDSTVIIIVCVVVGVLVLVGSGVGAAVFFRRGGSGYTLEDNTEMVLNDPSDHNEL